MRNKPNKIDRFLAEGYYQLESASLIKSLQENGVKVLNISPAGSLRRGKRRIGDLDIVIEVDNPDLCTQVLTKELEYKYFLTGAFHKGKINNTGIDLFVAGKYDFHSMLFFLTGSEDWNLKIMKHLADNTDIRFMPFRFFNNKTGETYKFSCEEDIFKLIKHKYVLPENRQPTNVNFGDTE